MQALNYSHSTTNYDYLESATLTPVSALQYSTAEKLDILNILRLKIDALGPEIVEAKKVHAIALERYKELTHDLTDEELDQYLYHENEGRNADSAENDAAWKVSDLEGKLRRLEGNVAALKSSDQEVENYILAHPESLTTQLCSPMTTAMRNSLFKKLKARAANTQESEQVKRILQTALNILELG